MSAEFNKIDIHDTELQLKQATTKLLSDSTISIRNRKFIIDYLDEAALGRTSTERSHIKEIGPRARLKNLYLLKISARFFKVDFDKITVDDMKNLIKALKSDELKKADNTNYSEQTKSNIKKTLGLLLRWIHKEGVKYLELTKWVDTRFKRKEPDSLTEDEIIRLVNSSSTMAQRFVITILYATGCRIEEFLNIRVRDCREIKGDVPYYVITLRNEYSKTKGRDIDLTWKDSNEVLRSWLDLQPKEAHNPLCELGYDAVRMMLSRLGKKVLGRVVSPHLLRHSAATRDASHMTHQQLCIKYGWSFSSNMPDIYIKRSGVDREAIVKKFKIDKIEDVQRQNSELQEKVKRMEAKHNRELESIRKKLDRAPEDILAKILEQLNKTEKRTA